MSSKLTISLKIGTPKGRKISHHRNSDFLSLDINGRSYSPQNMQENLYDMGIELKDQSPRFDYEGRKFKVRSPSSFIKTAQNWKNMPYQRIRNVEKAIQISKKKQFLAMSDRGTTILPQFDRFSPSTSPKTTQKRHRVEDQLKMYNKTQRKRLKQIQQTISKCRQQNKQQHNIIKFEQKRIKYFESKQFVINNEINNHNSMTQRVYQSKNRDNININMKMDTKINPNQNNSIGKQQTQIKNRSTLYAYMVKNRKKLSERRHNKKRSIDYSLLGRINYLQQQKNEENFVLKNSLQRVKFSQQLKRLY